MILDKLSKVYSTPEEVCCKKVLIRYRRDGEETVQERCAYEFILWRDRLIDFKGTQIPISRIVDIIEGDCDCKILELSGLKIAFCRGEIMYPQRGFLPTIRRGDAVAICDRRGNILKLKGEVNGYYVRDLWCYVW